MIKVIIGKIGGKVAFTEAKILSTEGKPIAAANLKLLMAQPKL